MSERADYLTQIKLLLDTYDSRANRKKKLFLRVWYSGIFSGVIAVIVFALITIYKAYLTKTWGGLILPITEVVLIVYSFIALSRLASGIKNSFINARRSAEILRMHELFARSGLPLKPSVFDLQEYKIPEDILEIERSNITSKDIIKENLSSILKELLKFINDPKVGQNKYHQKDRIEKFHRREHLLETILQVILWGFLSIILLKLGVELFKYFGYEELKEIKLKSALYAFKFSVIFLPPLYAALEGFYFFSEWKRNIKESEKVNEEYNALINQIENLLTQENLSQDDVEQVARKLYHVFHNENQNWYRWYIGKKIEARI